jgi:hypothetical protein
MKQFFSWTYGSIISIFLAALVFFIFIESPILYTKLIVEDGVVEYATFSSYLFASIIFLLSAIKDKSKKPVGLIIFSIGCFILAMEEISWGQRLLSLQSNSFFLENNLQNETNIHNLFGHRSFLIVFFGGVLSWAVLWPMLLRCKFSLILLLQEKLNIPLVSPALWPSFFVTSFLLVLDVPLRGEEIYEWYLGVLFLLSSFQGETIRISKKINYFIVSLGLALMLNMYSFSNATYSRALLNMIDNAYLPKGMCEQALGLHDELNKLDYKSHAVKTSYLETVYRSGGDYSDLLVAMLSETNASSTEDLINNAEIYQFVGNDAAVLNVLARIDIKSSAINESSFLRYMRVLVSIEDMNAINNLSSTFQLRRLQSVNKLKFESIDQSIMLLKQGSGRKIALENFIFNDLLSGNNCTN